MNLKRWFAWVCLVLVVVAEVSLFRAYSEKDALQADLRATQVQMHQMQDELNALRNSATGLQATEISRLRRQNQILTNQVAVWRAAVGPDLWFGQWSIGDRTLHPLVLLYALSGSLMISRIPIPKP